MPVIKLTQENGGDGINVPAVAGQSVWQAAVNAGVAIDSPCAGNGTCGKCRVKIDGVWSLACQSAITGDCEVYVPASATAYRTEIRTAGFSTDEEIRRYNGALEAIFASTLTRGVEQKGTGIAIDIGTTTVTAALVGLESGAALSAASAGNGQIRYGADVINRIIQSSRPGGREALQHAIREETVLPLINKLCFAVPVAPQEITRAVITGNTTMQHLFVGEDAQSIRLEPYVPKFLELTGKTAADLGLPIAPDAPVVFAPNVGSYVGGDITAGTLAAMMWDSDGMTLFIDLGTNGELVFGNRDFMLTCACSAGPAFEGGDISCGMRATPGAIEAVSIDADTMEPGLTVVGGSRPAGLCGSGLIATVSELFRCGIIDARGKIIRGGARVKRGEYEAAYVLAYAEESAAGRDIELTETDIGNFIRAKGAVFSAIRTLLNSVDMDAGDIDRILVAGGIGGGLDIKKAISIGLLPDLPEERYSYIGNSSLTGACAMLVSGDAERKVFELGRNMTYLELSSHPGYMDEFIAACFIPHTDWGRL